jgi:drug/metabolite transporter (DMT)-like permease
MSSSIILSSVFLVQCSDAVAVAQFEHQTLGDSHSFAQVKSGRHMVDYSQGANAGATLERTVSAYFTYDTLAFASVDPGMTTSSKALHSVPTENLKVFYPVAVMLMLGLVTATNYKKGSVVVTKILVYLTALSTMKLSVKLAFEWYSFQYPKFVTSLHLICSAACGFAILAYRSRAVKIPIAVPTTSEFLTGIAPSAAAFAMTLAFNNMALVLCSASFTEIVGATTPLVTVAFVILMGMPFYFPLIGPVCLVAVGCMLSATGELNFSMLGTFYCFAANVTRSARTSLQQKLLTGETKEKFDPPALLAWTCIFSFHIMIVWSVITEGFLPWKIAFGGGVQSLGLWVALAAGCINACILNLAVLFVTKDLGAVGAQIVAQIKSIATVMGGMCLLGESFTWVELAGFFTILLGTFLFSHIQTAQTAREQETKAPG